MEQNKLKKIKERFLIKRFLALDCCSATIFDQPDPPWPDAIIVYGGNKIGLDQTELYKTDDHQELQVFANNVTQVANELYKGEPSSFYITFEGGNTKEGYQELGKKLAAFLASATDEFYDSPLWEGQQLSQIKKIRILRYSGMPYSTRSAWRTEVYSPNESIIESLRKRIADKETKRQREYTSVISRNWLLITISTIQDSQFFHWMPFDFNEAILMTGFERVVLCDLTTNRVYEIPPK